MSGELRKRELRPRVTASLPVQPATVSDLTAPVVFGLEARPFRELLVRERVPHARVGQRVLARLEDVLSALDRLARRDQTPADGEVETDDSQPESADGVLRLLGRERAR